MISFKELIEKVELEEAKIPVEHAVKAVTKVLGSQSAAKFATHLKPGTEKHTTWDKVNTALKNQGVKPQHIAKIAVHTKPEQYEEVEVEESFAADFLAMAKNRNPNARISTADQRKKEADELAKKREGLKPVHAAPTGNARPLGGHDPKSGRSYSEEVELDEATIKVGDVVVWNKGKTAQTVGKVHKIEGDHYILHHAKTNTYHKVPKQGSQLAESELDEAKGALTYKPEHAKWGVVPKSSKEFVKFFPKDKEADAKAHAEKTGGTLKKIDQAGRAMKEEIEQVDEISTELKQKYLGAATKKHLQQFLGRAPVRGKQELDKRRAAIQKTSKELTGKTHYQEEAEIDEALDFKKEAAKHMKDMHDKNATPANKAYAQKMLQRALEASKMKDKVAATKHYMGEEVELDEEQLDELSKEKLGWYLKKAVKNMNRKGDNMIKRDKKFKTGMNPLSRSVGGLTMRQDSMAQAAKKYVTKEEVEPDEVMEGQLRNFSPHSDLAGRGRLSGYNKTAAGKKREADRETERLKDKMKFAKSQGGIAGPKGKLPEEAELDEAVKKKLAIGSKVSHPEHGKGTVVMHSLGGGTSGTVVKFANGKKMRVDHKKLRMEEVEVDQKMLSFGEFITK